MLVLIFVCLPSWGFARFICQKQQCIPRAHRSNFTALLHPLEVPALPRGPLDVPSTGTVSPTVGFVSFTPSGQLSFPWPGCVLAGHSISTSDVSWHISSQLLGGLARLCRWNGNTWEIHTWLRGTSWGGKKPPFTVLNVECPFQVWLCWAPLELLNYRARLAVPVCPTASSPGPNPPGLLQPDTEFVMQVSLFGVDESRHTPACWSATRCSGNPAVRGQRPVIPLYTVKLLPYTSHHNLSYQLSYSHDAIF